MKDEKLNSSTDEVGSDGDLVSMSNDDALLMSMGKKPELRRVYNFWTCRLSLTRY